MKIQLDTQQLALTRAILGPLLKDTWVYGSRAKGSARPLSDLDLVIRAAVTRDKLIQLRDQFEESKLPFKVDLVTWTELDASFQAQIEGDLVSLA
jgi:uncharacterized protein